MVIILSASTSKNSNGIDTNAYAYQYEPIVSHVYILLHDERFQQENYQNLFQQICYEPHHVGDEVVNQVSYKSDLQDLITFSIWFW